MADLGLSQARQVENLGNSPAGQTGYPTGSSGNSYGMDSDRSQPSGNDDPSQPAKLHSGLSSTGTGTVNDASGDPYAAAMDVSTLQSDDTKSISSPVHPTLRKP